MSRSRTTASVLLAVSLALVASGCGSDDARDAVDRSPRPSTATTRSLATARAHLTDVAEVAGSDTGLAMRNGDRARYVTTREGLVQRIAPKARPTTLLDLRRKVTLDGEGGVFDLAFTTDGTELLVSYADKTTHDLQVIRFEVGPDGARATDPVTVATVGDGGEIHHAGKLLVLPDGDLLLGVGDGGELNAVAGRARRPGSERGRILRYPGLGRSGVAAPVHPVTVAWGLRNPWRFFRDPVTGSIWIGDVGQASWEEVDLLRSPRTADPVDFGWDLTEGFARSRGLPPPGMRFPAMVSGHDASHCAIIGGPIIRDRTLPDLSGSLVLGDFCSSDVRFVRTDAAGRPLEQRRLRLPGEAKVTSFAVGTDNEVYVLRTDGVISRLDPGGPALVRDPAPLEVRPRPTLSGPRSVCGITEAIAAYPALQGKPPAEVRQLAGDLAAALDAYRQADLPDAARALFAQLDTGLVRYLTRLEAAGWDTSAPEVSFGDELIAEGSAAYAALGKVEQSACD